MGLVRWRQQQGSHDSKQHHPEKGKREGSTMAEAGCGQVPNGQWPSRLDLYYRLQFRKVFVGHKFPLCIQRSHYGMALTPTPGVGM